MPKPGHTYDADWAEGVTTAIGHIISHLRDVGGGKPETMVRLTEVQHQLAFYTKIRSAKLEKDT